MEFYSIYEYDEEYKLIRTNTYDGNGVLNVSKEYEYWDNGNTKRCVTYDVNGKMIRLDEFDENGETVYWECFE